MTPTEAARDHLLSVAVDERRAHLVRCIEMYRERGWIGLELEYVARLDELDWLRVMAMPSDAVAVAG